MNADLRHTPEPWAFGECGGRLCLYAPHSGQLLILDAGAGPRRGELRVAIRDVSQEGIARGGIMHKVSDLPDPAAHPDLARIVACVNFCAGSPTSDLLAVMDAGRAVDAGGLEYTKALLGMLTQQRNELLEIAQAVVLNITSTPDENVVKEIEQIYHRCVAAIAKVTA